MGKFNTLPIQDAMRNFMREIGLETPLLEHRVEQAWSQVAGEAVMRYTKEAKVRGGVLHVKLTSAPLRQNLMMNHRQLAQQLNEIVGAQVITDVSFL